MAVVVVMLFRGLAGLGYCDWHRSVCAENASYATDYFDGLAPVQSVLESRAWHTPPFLVYDGSGSFDCTYAVALLQPDAPVLPPTRTSKPTKWTFEWGEGWVRVADWTAHWSNQISPKEIVALCSEYWSVATKAKVDQAMADPETYVSSQDTDLMFVWSAKHQIAARVRLGD